MRSGCIGFTTLERAEHFKLFIENNVPCIKDSVEIHSDCKKQNYEYDFAVTFNMLSSNERKCVYVINNEMAKM